MPASRAKPSRDRDDGKLGEMKSPPQLNGILETVLYCDSSNEEEVRRFYADVIGLDAMDLDFGYRVGGEAHVLLVFNRDDTQEQDSPPPHGATGKGHVCFTATTGTYESWKGHLDARGIAWHDEITWGNGMRSFYFEDPAGNVLEIAEGDFWPR